MVRQRPASLDDSLALDWTSKKTAHALEQDRPDVLRRRHAWFEGQLDLDPARLVFIDGEGDPWLSNGLPTKMVRLRGRERRGDPGRSDVPHGH